MLISCDSNRHKWNWHNQWTKEDTREKITQGKQLFLMLSTCFRLIFHVVLNLFLCIMTQFVLVNPVGSVMEKLHESHILESFGLEGLYLSVGEAVADISSAWKSQPWTSTMASTATHTHTHTQNIWVGWRSSCFVQEELNQYLSNINCMQRQFPQNVPR